MFILLYWLIIYAFNNYLLSVTNKVIHVVMKYLIIDLLDLAFYIYGEFRGLCIHYPLKFFIPFSWRVMHYKCTVLITVYTVCPTKVVLVTQWKNLQVQLCTSVVTSENFLSVCCNKQTNMVKVHSWSIVQCMVSLSPLHISSFQS